MCMTPLNRTTSSDQNPTTADTASHFFLLLQGLTEPMIPTSVCQLEQEQNLSFYYHLLKVTSWYSKGWLLPRDRKAYHILCPEARFLPPKAHPHSTQIRRTGQGRPRVSWWPVPTKSPDPQASSS